MALIVLSGCTTGVMQTSRQLKDGDLIISAVADEPGFYIIPRLSGNIAYGIGDVADISLNIGTTVLTYSTGLGVRVYPVDWMTLSAQGNYNLIGAITNGDTTDGIGSLSLKATTATKPGKRPVYGGLSAVVAGIKGDLDVFNEFEDSNARDLRFLSLSMGLVGGVETDLGDDMTLQVELAYMPLGSNAGTGGFGLFPLSKSGFTPFIVQLGFAVHFQFPAEPAARPTQPAEVDAPNALPPRPVAPPVPAPAPVPPPADGPEAVPVP
jgi:hypothetical protein